MVTMGEPIGSHHRGYSGTHLQPSMTIPSLKTGGSQPPGLRSKLTSQIAATGAMQIQPQHIWFVVLTVYRNIPSPYPTVPYVDPQWVPPPQKG